MKDDHTGRLVEAFILHDQMEDTRWYLERGRVYAAIADEDLDTCWVETFRAVLVRGDDSRQTEFDDLGAELRLRGRPTPDRLVVADMAVVQKRLRAADTPARRQLIDREIKRFLQELARPQH
jgi:hypothetical protein